MVGAERETDGEVVNAQGDSGYDEPADRLLLGRDGLSGTGAPSLDERVSAGGDQQASADPATGWRMAADSAPAGAATLAGFCPLAAASTDGIPGMAIYQHIRHPRIASRLADRPVKVADLLPRGTAVNRFNTRVALLVTRVVGSMWCAYVFALFDLISLPAAIHSGTSAIVSWVAQTFLQLVLLSVIMVGQNVQAAASDKRAEATFHDASATLHEVAHAQAPEG